MQTFFLLINERQILNQLEVITLNKKEIEKQLKETHEKMAGVLTAISVVSKDLAQKLVELEQRIGET